MFVSLGGVAVGEKSEWVMMGVIIKQVDIVF